MISETTSSVNVCRTPNPMSPSDVTEVLRRTKFHRDLTALRKKGRELRDLLAAFWLAHDDGALGGEFFRAGVDFDTATDDETVWLACPEQIPADVTELQEALELFLRATGWKLALVLPGSKVGMG